MQNGAATTTTFNSDTLTLASLEKTISEFCDVFGKPPNPYPLGLSLGSFGSIKLYEMPSDIRPVLQQRDDVGTPEGRREMNAWLLKMFGTRDHSLVKRGTAIMWNGSALMRKEDMVRLINFT